MVGCIPEVLTLLLTPILTLLHGVCQSTMHVIYDINVIYDIYDIWHLTYIYFNMGVKRSVRNSGMQPTILDILENCFQGQNMKYPVSGFFLCIFQNFLCIFHLAWGTPKSSNVQLKFFWVSNLIYSNGKTCLMNHKISFFKSDPPAESFIGDWPSGYIILRYFTTKTQI